MDSTRSRVWDHASKSVIVKALNDLKSAGASFRAHLAQCIQKLGYKLCKADSDQCMNSETWPEAKLEY